MQRPESPSDPEDPAQRESSSIADVERETGISKDTLRVWERRYGSPTPFRDASGERRYAPAELERLRLVRRLLDAGHRPGGVVSLPRERLQELAESAGSARPRTRQRTPVGGSGGVAGGDWIAWLKANRTETLREALQKHLVEHGLAATVENVVAPLGVQVGEAWLAGTLSVFQEHVYTEVVQAVFREAMAGIDSARAGNSRAPRVLLTTLAGERHALGLLLAECFLALDGCERIALGPGTPVAEVIEAARQVEADVVALGFSAHPTPRTVLHELRQVRERVPAHVEIWAGGRSRVLQRGSAGAGIAVLRRASDVSAEVARWRSLHAHGTRGAA